MRILLVPIRLHHQKEELEEWTPFHGLFHTILGGLFAAMFVPCFYIRSKLEWQRQFMCYMYYGVRHLSARIQNLALLLISSYEHLDLGFPRSIWSAWRGEDSLDLEAI